MSFERDDDDALPATYSVSRTLTHPEYQTNIQYHDVALVELAQPLQFSQYARPACLNSRTNIPDQRAITTGWGLTEFAGYDSETLLKVTLDLFKFNECQPRIQTSFRLREGIIENQHLCAGSYAGEEKDACEGDSGGPIQVYHTGVHCMYNILGVTSFGTGCGFNVGLYARVSNYIDWIEANAFRHG